MGKRASEGGIHQCTTKVLTPNTVGHKFYPCPKQKRKKTHFSHVGEFQSPGTKRRPAEKEERERKRRRRRREKRALKEWRRRRK